MSRQDRPVTPITVNRTDFGPNSGQTNKLVQLSGLPQRSHHILNNATTDILIGGFLTTIDLEAPNHWSTKGQGGDIPLSDLRSRFHSIVRSDQTASRRPPGVAGEKSAKRTSPPCPYPQLARLKLHHQLLRPQLIGINRPSRIMRRMHHIVPPQQQIIQRQRLLVPHIRRQAQLIGHHPPTDRIGIADLRPGHHHH